MVGDIVSVSSLVQSCCNYPTRDVDINIGMENGKNIQRHFDVLFSGPGQTLPPSSDCLMRIYLANVLLLPVFAILYVGFGHFILIN